MKKKSILISEIKQKNESKFKLGQLVRAADFKKKISKRDSTNWSYKLFTFTEVIHVTIPSYRIKFLPERYSETKINKLNP